MALVKIPKVVLGRAVEVSGTLQVRPAQLVDYLLTEHSDTLGPESVALASKWGILPPYDLAPIRVSYLARRNVLRIAEAYVLDRWAVVGHIVSSHLENLIAFPETYSGLDEVKRRAIHPRDPQVAIDESVYIPLRRLANRRKVSISSLVYPLCLSLRREDIQIAATRQSFHRFVESCDGKFRPVRVTFDFYDALSDVSKAKKVSRALLFSYLLLDELDIAEVRRKR